MSDFKAKMHQIRFRFTALPQTPIDPPYKGPTSKGRGWRGRVWEEKGRKGAERKGRNGKGTHSGLDPVPLPYFFGGYTPMVVLMLPCC